MVRVLVFDEVHNLLAGSPREQRVILQLFRHLSNELKASLVCLGVADARDAIAGDVQLARRLDQLVLPRWKGDEEFQEMVTAILRSLPLKRPSVLSAQGLRHLVRIADGITARVFGVLNELAIDAVATGAECISDTVIETWKPAIERRPLSPDSASKLALKLRLNDAPVSISVPLFTQIRPSPRFECKSTTVSTRVSLIVRSGRCWAASERCFNDGTITRVSAGVIGLWPGWTCRGSAKKMLESRWSAAGATISRRGSTLKATGAFIGLRRVRRKSKGQHDGREGSGSNAG